MDDSGRVGFHPFAWPPTERIKIAGPGGEGEAFSKVVSQGGIDNRAAEVFLKGGESVGGVEPGDGEIEGKIRGGAVATVAADRGADIIVFEQLDEAAAQAQAQTLEGWNRKTIRTFPAIQVFGTDGHLLKTVQGREMREIISPALLSHVVKGALASAGQRQELLGKIEAARKSKDAEKELEELFEIAGTPRSAPMR